MEEEKMGANNQEIGIRMHKNQETSSLKRGENETGEFSEPKNMLNDLRQTKKKYTSKGKHSFFSKGDSEEYQAVKKDAENLTSLLNTKFESSYSETGKYVSSSYTEHDGQIINEQLIDEVNMASWSLRDSCKKYLDKNANPRSTSGKMRRKKVEELQRFAEEVSDASDSMRTAYLFMKFDENREDNKLGWDKIIQSYRRAKTELESPSN